MCSFLLYVPAIIYIYRVHQQSALKNKETSSVPGILSMLPWKRIEQFRKLFYKCWKKSESTCCLPTPCRSPLSCSALGHHSNNSNNKAANTAGLAGLSSQPGRRVRGSAAHSESTREEHIHAHTHANSRSKLANVVRVSPQCEREGGRERERQTKRERESAAMQCSLCVCSRVEWLLLTSPSVWVGGGWRWRRYFLLFLVVMLCLRSRSLSYAAASDFARCVHRYTASWDWRRSPFSVLRSGLDSGKCC